MESINGKRKNHCVGHRARLKSKLIASSASLLDYELVEMLLFYIHLRKDTKSLAKDLLKNFKSIRNLILADPYEVQKTLGVGKSTLILIKLLRELFERMQLEIVASSVVISSSKHVIDYYKNVLGHLKKEQLRIMFLNNKNKLLADEIMQTGTVNTTAIYPREIIHKALEYGASAIIMVHNHPSGDPQPSRQDVIVTKMVKDVADRLDIILLDHLIIGKDTSLSMKEMQLI
jgi:DNA repair protein RadC